MGESTIKVREAKLGKLARCFDIDLKSGELSRNSNGRIIDSVVIHVVGNRIIFILEWTTRLDTSSRTLFVREGGTMSVRMSTSRRTSSYVITSDCY